MAKGCAYFASRGKTLLWLFFLQPIVFGWRQNSSSSSFASWGKIKLHDFTLAGQDWIGLIVFKNLRIRTGSDSISSDQDWTRNEKFHGPLISGDHCWSLLQSCILTKSFLPKLESTRKVRLWKMCLTSDQSVATLDVLTSDLMFSDTFLMSNVLVTNVMLTVLLFLFSTFPLLSGSKFKFS